MFELDGFTITDEGERFGAWRVACKKCRTAWRLKKGGEKHPGNLLHLLNHRAGHQERESKKGR